MKSAIRNTGLSFVLIASMVLFPGFSHGTGDLPQAGKISVNIENGTLGQALIQAAERAGYAIALSGEWSLTPISIHLDDLTLEEAVRRILDNRINYAVVWNYGKRQVRILGVAGRMPATGAGIPAAGPVPVPGRHPTGQGVRFEQGSKTVAY